MISVADPGGGDGGGGRKRKNVCANLNPKNPGIDFYSGFRKNGRCKSEILKKIQVYTL